MQRRARGLGKKSLSEQLRQCHRTTVLSQGTDLELGSRPESVQAVRERRDAQRAELSIQTDRYFAQLVRRLRRRLAPSAHVRDSLARAYRVPAGSELRIAPRLLAKRMMP